MTPKSVPEQIFSVEYSFELIRIAEGDLDSAKALLQVGQGRKENICYLAEQAVEKTLKAVLCYKNFPIPLVHDIGILLARMPNDLVPPHGFNLHGFSPFATVRRYEESRATISTQQIMVLVEMADDVLVWAKSIIICG